MRTELQSAKEWLESIGKKRTQELSIKHFQRLDALDYGNNIISTWKIEVVLPWFEKWSATKPFNMIVHMARFRDGEKDATDATEEEITIMYITEHDERYCAMNWWGKLSKEKKAEFFMGYAKFTPANNHDEMTGREIQNIWAVEVTSPIKQSEEVVEILYEALKKLASFPINVLDGGKTEEMVKNAIKVGYNFLNKKV